MGALEFGTYDNFAAYEMKTSSAAADVYEQHIREVQQAEELGYKYYFIIEHQNSDVGQLTAPSVYLSAVAQRTSTIRFGVMIYQLPFYNPIRLAEEAAMLDQLSRGRLEFGTGIGVAEHEFVRWNLPFYERRQMSQEALEIIINSFRRAYKPRALSVVIQCRCWRSRASWGPIHNALPVWASLVQTP